MGGEMSEMATPLVTKIRVRYRKGVFEPLEPVDLPEDTEAQVVFTPDFFALLDEARANVEASGVSDEEWEQAVMEACEAAREETWKEVQERVTGEGMREGFS